MTEYGWIDVGDQGEVLKKDNFKVQVWQNLGTTINTNKALGRGNIDFQRKDIQFFDLTSQGEGGFLNRKLRKGTDGIHLVGGMWNDSYPYKA